MPKLADKYHCSGCLSCVESCNTGALYAQWNEEGHLTYGVIQDKCVNCHRCEVNCPAGNGFQYGVNDLFLSTPYAAWCTDDSLRSNSTSGGVFAAIAKTILSKGGVVVGASMRNNDINHIIIEKEEDIHFLQGSKYAQSNTEGIYRKVSEFLKTDRLVLFSGLGCQVAGLLNFLPHNRIFDNLYTIDLICGGIPSRSLITKYLDHESDRLREIKSFRNKSRYEFSVINSSGCTQVIPLSQRPLPLCGFYTELTNKYICYDCPFVGAHRKSDLTIGDFWGDTKYPEEHSKGLSIAIAHSEKIKELMEESPLVFQKVDWKDFLFRNSRMVYGRNEGDKSRRRKALAEAIAKDSYNKFVIDYANGATPKYPLDYSVKVIRFICSKVKPDKRIKYVKQLLKRK